MRIRKNQMQEQTVNIRVSNHTGAGNIGDQSEHFENYGYGYSLEQHLYSFSDTEAYRPLWINWISEKESYRKKLKGVAPTFVTYSSHSADHSDIVLCRIESFLGEDRIRLLSPTDTWLLLQCAYTHDLGMVVSEAEKRDMVDFYEKDAEKFVSLLNNFDFKEYLRKTDLFANTGADMNDPTAAASVRFLLRIIEGDDEEEKARFVEQIKNVSHSHFQSILSTALSNFYRQKHAQRTRKMLLEEALEEKILPKRLRRLVAEIDYCHAGTWEDAILGLPWKNDGFHTDHVHPRFVASLLRLGDLLDLDSNRFDYQQVLNASHMPISSALHYLKHAAITSLLVSPEEICIEARFRYEESRNLLNAIYFEQYPNLSEKEIIEQTYELMDKAAKITQSWISWVKQDLQALSSNWTLVIPSNMTGYVASMRSGSIFIGESDCPISEEDINLHYEMNLSKASLLMQGSVLYDSSWVFIRELVTNAVDAVKTHIIQKIMREWMTESTPSQEDYLRYLNEASLKQLGVQVEIRFIPGKIGRNHSEEILPRLDFCFKDFGVGITKQKLKDMRRIQSIGKALEEKKWLNAAPAWLRPTGEFGLGMQAAFGYVDTIDVTTYPRYEDGFDRRMKRNLRFCCPETGGDIVSWEAQKEEGEKFRYGTDVRLSIELNPMNLARLFADSSAFGYRRTNVIGLTSSRLFSELQHYINTTFCQDIVPIEFHLIDESPNDTTISIPSFLEYAENIRYHSNPLRVSFWRYGNQDAGRTDNFAGLLLERSEKADVQLFYKGIRIMIPKAKNDEADRMLSLFRIPNTLLKINIMSEKAGRLLELNRDRIKPGQHEMVRKLIRNALVAFYVASADYAKAMMFKKTESEMTESEKNALEDFKQFWSSSAKHLKTFVDIMKQQGDPLSKELVRAIDSHNQGDVPFIAIYNGVVNVSYPPVHELVSFDGWLTGDHSWGNLGGPRTLLSVEDEAFEATVDSWSAWYGLNYQKIKVFKENTERAPIFLYTLTDDENVYPEISFEDYRTLCNSIVEDYLQRYRAAEEGLEKLRIGKSVLIFPAIEEYKKIAVRCVPAETPDELIGQYTQYILCPSTVEQLGKWVEGEELFDGRFLWRNETVREKAMEFVNTYFAPAEKRAEKRKTYVEEYERFLDFLGSNLSSDPDSRPPVAASRESSSDE